MYMNACMSYIGSNELQKHFHINNLYIVFMKGLTQFMAFSDNICNHIIVVTKDFKQGFITLI